MRRQTNQRTSRQAGFTLVELLVTMVLMSILALMLPNFIANWLQASSEAQARSDLLLNAETALDTINQDIRLSGGTDQNNRWPDQNAPTAPGNLYGWTSSNQVLVLAKAAFDSGNNAIFSDPAKYITEKDNEVYYLSGGTLYRRTIASSNASDAAVTTCPPADATASCPADRTIATGVSNFAISYYDANEDVVTPTDARSVQLSITLKRQNGSRTITAKYDSRMVFRND